MLYSKNGEFPKPLPYRIILSSGLTRTNPTTFTPEDIQDAGYTLAPTMPIPAKYEALSWSGSDWVLTETRTLQTAKIFKLEDLKRSRQAAETDFTFQGMFIRLDEGTQARINSALKGFELAPPGTTTPWEVSTGNFIELDQVQLSAIGQAAWEHVRQCFIHSKSITDQINACANIAEVDEIDVDNGWPSG